MSEMGPQVECRFVRSESPVNVVKSTPQPSEMINLLYDCTCQYVFNIKLKLFKIRGKHFPMETDWKIVSVGNGSRLRKYNPERSARFPSN